ncbi:hypothetical protein H6F95_13165 [Cyanobacteria bacterium FACHB-471]|nr:hypothetical protein [Cyanobacteria bacterium FACHB-471]
MPLIHSRDKLDSASCYSERKQAETKLQEQEQFLRQMIDSTSPTPNPQSPILLQTFNW